MKNHSQSSAGCSRSRRQFLKHSALIAAPMIVPASVLGKGGATAPSERITPGHIGYVSQELGRAIKWDPAKEQVIGDEEAQKLLTSLPFRKGYSLD